LGKLQYNPNYINPKTGILTSDPVKQATEQVSAYIEARSKSIPRCVEQKTAKYTSPSHKSPSFLANRFSGQTFKTKSPPRCVEQTTAKYTERKSPPYPANQCRGQTIKGNDGNKYRSTPNLLNVCSWEKITE
jgi:hypothetical protein